MTIRAASVRDLDAIVRLWEMLMASHRALNATLYETKPTASATWRAFARRHLDKRGTVFLVATDGPDVQGDVVGYLLGAVGQRAPIYTIGEIGMIYDLVVAPGKRRRGTGEALFLTAADWFRGRGVRHLQVHFDARNPSSSRFWPKMGFDTLLDEAYLIL